MILQRRSELPEKGCISCDFRCFTQRVLYRYRSAKIACVEAAQDYFLDA